MLINAARAGLPLFPGPFGMQLSVCSAAASNAAGSAAASTSASSSLEARPAAVTSDTQEGGAIPDVHANNTAAVNADNTAAESLRGVRATMHHVVSTVQLLQPGVAAVWKRAFVVDMLVTVRVITSSSLCLAATMALLPCLGKCLGSDGTNRNACAVLCHAVLCHAVLCHATLHHAVSCCATLCCAVLWYATPCCVMLCHAVLCYARLCCAVLCCAVLCCAVLCCAALCNAVM